jgi:hypothetical protein
MSASLGTAQAHGKDELLDDSTSSYFKQRILGIKQALAKLEQDVRSLALQNQTPGPPATTSISVKRFWLICFG